MHIPSKINIVMYKDCNFINEFDAFMCHTEKVLNNRLLYSTRD